MVGEILGAYLWCFLPYFLKKLFATVADVEILFLMGEILGNFPDFFLFATGYKGPTMLGLICLCFHFIVHFPPLQKPTLPQFNLLPLSNSGDSLLHCLCTTYASSFDSEDILPQTTYASLVFWLGLYVCTC